MVIILFESRNTFLNNRRKFCQFPSEITSTPQGDITQIGQIHNGTNVQPGFSGVVQTVQNATDVLVNINVGENWQGLLNRTGLSSIMTRPKILLPTDEVRKCMLGSDEQSVDENSGCS